ncbi:MAG: redoxin domain-containing protein [Sphingobacterium sp.]|jgi:thiol-disulfide isomerase/thioredoxin|nr:redoxin domain-containing protein [Sphingobacterium sp.]
MPIINIQRLSGKGLMMALLFMLFFPSKAFLQTVNKEIFRLTDINKNSDTSFVPSELATVYIFLSPECPLCQNYTKEINALAKQYGDKISFIGIFPGEFYESSEIQAFATKYKLNIPLFQNNNLNLTNFLHVKITPTVTFVEKGKVIYFGAIDNWAVDLGKKRTVTTAHYLADALRQYLKKQAITIKKTEPIGCIIN